MSNPQAYSLKQALATFSRPKKAGGKRKPKIARETVPGNDDNEYEAGPWIISLYVKFERSAGFNGKPVVRDTDGDVVTPDKDGTYPDGSEQRYLRVAGTENMPVIVGFSIRPSESFKDDVADVAMGPFYIPFEAASAWDKTFGGKVLQKATLALTKPVQQAVAELES